MCVQAYVHVRVQSCAWGRGVGVACVCTHVQAYVHGVWTSICAWRVYKHVHVEAYVHGVCVCVQAYVHGECVYTSIKCMLSLCMY